MSDPPHVQAAIKLSSPFCRICGQGFQPGTDFIAFPYPFECLMHSECAGRYFVSNLNVLRLNHN